MATAKLQAQLEAAIKDYALRRSQLRNMRIVMNSSMPKKKYDYLSKHVMPGYVVRNFNAQGLLGILSEKINKKMVEKAQKKKAVSKQTAKKTKDDTLTKKTKGVSNANI